MNFASSIQPAVKRDTAPFIAKLAVPLKDEEFILKKKNFLRIHPLCRQLKSKSTVRTDFFQK